MATGVIVPKPGTEDYSSPKSFRIISLTPVIHKMLESLVLGHLQFDLMVPLSLKKTQFGFRRGSSTEAAVHCLTREIEKSLEAGSYALGVFLDIEGAFDNVSFSSIKESLSSVGISGLVGDWIYSSVLCK